MPCSADALTGGDSSSRMPAAGDSVPGNSYRFKYHPRKSPDVLIDLTAMDTPSRFRGIGRYTLSLAGAMAEMAAEGCLDLCIEGLVRYGPGPAGPLTDPTLGYSGNPDLRPSDWQYYRYKMMRRLSMGTLAARTGARLLHVLDPKGTPWDSRVPRIVTCHDLIPLILHEDYLTRIPGLRAIQLLRDRIRYHSANRLIAISESTRRDAIALLGIDPNRVDVVYHGVDHERFNRRGEEGELERVEAALGVHGPFLLYIGGADSRKRLELLIRAYAGARRTRDAALVIAGMQSRRRRKKLESAAAAAGVSSRVIFAGFVDDKLVPALYRTCLGHVFPSVYEGFGLPVLEGMSCGAPTITTLETALGEVVADAGLIVPADDEDALAEAIRRLIDDSGLRRDLAARGVAGAARFTWRRCAARTVECYRRALEEVS